MLNVASLFLPEFALVRLEAIVLILYLLVDYEAALKHQMHPGQRSIAAILPGREISGSQGLSTFPAVKECD